MLKKLPNGYKIIKHQNNRNVKFWILIVNKFKKSLIVFRVEEFTDCFIEILKDNRNGLIAIIDGGKYQEFVQNIYVN